MRATALSFAGLLPMFAPASSRAALHAGGAAQARGDDAVLTRDVDKRPLPTARLEALSIAMRKAVQERVAEERRLVDPQSAVPQTPAYTLQRIPVAQHDHRLYLLAFTGDLGCFGNTPNCIAVVFDEMANGVYTVLDDGVMGVSVVRRPHMQLPDLAVVTQDGHVSMETTVLRYDGKDWKPFRCDHVPTEEVTTMKRIVADKPCTRQLHRRQRAIIRSAWFPHTAW